MFKKLRGVIEHWLVKVFGAVGFLGELHIEDWIETEITRNDGTIERKVLKHRHNTITKTGFAAVAGLMGDVDSQDAFTRLALGTDSTAESSSHTALQAEITTDGLERHVATVTRETTTETNDTLQLEYTWTATGTKTVEEVGVVNAAAAGIMLGRKLTGTDDLVSGNQYKITYKIKVS